MASSLLFEEQLLCPICLDVFVQPVSTPCGHNFCMLCIATYWNGLAVCRCPVCKEAFERRPLLKVNTFISELVSQFASLQVTDAHAWMSDERPDGGGAVPCDVCADARLDAVKSCLECLTSYCDAHLEPHRRAPGLKRHTLVGPVSRLEERVCRPHAKLLALFCRNDEALLCAACAAAGDHAGHDVAPVPRAYAEMKDRVGAAEARVQRMIRERQLKVEATREAVKQSAADTGDAIATSEQDAATLVSEIQRSQEEFRKAMEEKQEAAASQAEGFISGVEQDVAALQAAAAALEELKEAGDQFRFLQKASSSALLPRTVDPSAFAFSRRAELRRLADAWSRAASRMRTLLSQTSAEVKQLSDAGGDGGLESLQRHEVDVVLDPDSAHPLLIVSGDGKQVRYSLDSRLWGNRLLGANTFTEHLAVLGLRGFYCCRFYFEVCVGAKSEWCLGVATASIQRRGSLSREPGCGLWAIWFLVDRFETFSSPGVSVHFGKVAKVGVFVDYDGGLVSFYDVETAALIYSFTGCLFTEELHPYFNPCDDEYGSNLQPMIIAPVSHTA